MGGETAGLGWEWNGMGLIVYCCSRLTGVLHVVMKWNVFMFWFRFGLDWSAELGLFVASAVYVRNRVLGDVLGVFL